MAKNTSQINQYSSLHDTRVSSNDTREDTRQVSKERFSRAKNAWFTYYRNHQNQVIYSVVGLFIAVGFLVIGFWSTLLIVVFVTIGVIYGRYKDGDRKTRNAIARLIDRLE